ncbi:hypothetical protein [Nesterenkonia muleiensis]|uniref:hypothetical protein n=1 Tax=Nesterenkonia muleiensis TaxID=2282648 RepID=UPI000E731B2D|nr:hypothetical protein [Nesterenkonia muleiensis]
MSTPPNDTPPTGGSPQWEAPGQGAGNDAAANPYGQQSGSKFGTEAYSANAYGGPVEEPQKYSLLKTMTLVSFGLYLVSGIFGLIPMFTGEAEDIAREQLEGQDLGGVSVDDALAMGMAFSWVFILVPLVISIVLYLLVYFGLKGNKGWARVLGIVMAIIGLLLTIGGLLFDTAMFSSAIGMVALVISIAWAAATVYWLVLAFNSEVTGYLQQFKR